MAELPQSLISASLHLAGLIDPTKDTAPDPDSQPAVSERLGAHRVLTYATVEGADSYRRIMRILYLEHQAFGLRLRPAQVADRMRQRYARNVELDWLEGRLAALHDWGALERDHDASLAPTAQEWRRNRYTYDVTPAGRLTEELLSRLDSLGQEIGRLDSARLPNIRDALAKLVDGLDRADTHGVELRELFEKVLSEIEQLHAGALAFMHSLSDLMRTVERVSEAEFERGKGALLDHLQGFRRTRAAYSAEIITLLAQIQSRDAEVLVGRIVDAEEFVALPGGESVASQSARRRTELLDRWHGVELWFGADERGSSPWRTLSDQVVEAIRAILAIAERLIERRMTRIDRTSVLLHLAAQVAAAPSGEASAWLRGAFGLRTPRHLGAPEADPEQVPDRGRTGWRDAPPAPVVAHLRTPGARQPGSGRSARIPDLSESAARLRERRLAEHRELEVMLTRMSARGPTSLSSLREVDALEFRHLLDWIARAYESPALGDSTRRASSADGRATIILRPPADPRTSRTRVRTPHGTLDTPDYGLEVTRR